MIAKRIELFGGPLDGALIVVGEQSAHHLASPLLPTAADDHFLHFDLQFAGTYEPRTNEDHARGRWTWKANP